VCNQDINDPLTCFNCTELRNSLYSALTELSTLQVINKLLFKELEMATTKLEVMSGVVSNSKMDESRNSWCMPKRKECESEDMEVLEGTLKLNVYIHHIFPYLLATGLMFWQI
jgi:hypothetical protein